MKNRIVLLMILSTLLFSCKAKKEVEASVVYTPVDTVDTVVAVVIPVITDSTISTQIKPVVTHLDSSQYYIEDQYIFSNKELTRAYDSNQYYPLWNNPKNREDAINALINAPEHGLLPSDYHLHKILNYNSRFDDLNIEERASYDMLLTDAVLLYSYHLSKGKLNPESLSESWNFISRDMPRGTSDLLLESLQKENVTETLAQFEPQDEEYVAIRKALTEQYSVVLDGGWPVITLSSTIHSLETDTNMPLLRERLILEGYLAASDTSQSIVYDKRLEWAIKHFQKQHGLNPDGVIGSGTLRMINITAKQKLEMLTTNLERRRWTKFPKNKPYIKVNIASFRLQFYEEGEEIYTSKVMVGQTKTQTPVFADRLELIVFNPTWKLPQSISSKETLPKLKRDSNYLANNNMVLINHKGQIEPNVGIDWNKYDENYFPFMVRQEPGPFNSLGRVKFLFPNKYAIYLHDTPSKYLFAKESRAFSHGCIRLQKPLDFALFLLERQDTVWSMDSIKVILDTAQTQTIRLRKSIPIFIMYQTVGVNADHEVYYYYDVYGRDNTIYQNLIHTDAVQEFGSARLKGN